MRSPSLTSPRLPCSCIPCGFSAGRVNEHMSLPPLPLHAAPPACVLRRRGRRGGRGGRGGRARHRVRRGHGCALRGQGCGRVRHRPGGPCIPTVSPHTCLLPYSSSLVFIFIPCIFHCCLHVCFLFISLLSPHLFPHCLCLTSRAPGPLPVMAWEEGLSVCVWWPTPPSARLHVMCSSCCQSWQHRPHHTLP